MNQRKDSYRAALQRGQDSAAPRSVKVAALHSRYVRVTVEVDPALRRDLARWIGPPASTLVSSGANVLRAVAARLTALTG
jgi:hypothetical protein